MYQYIIVPQHGKGLRNTGVHVSICPNLVDAISQRPLSGFCSNFVGLLVTICGWSYSTTILMWQIYVSYGTLLIFYMVYYRNTFVNATPQKLLLKFCRNVSNHMWLIMFPCNYVSINLRFYRNYWASTFLWQQGGIWLCLAILF